MDRTLAATATPEPAEWSERPTPVPAESSRYLPVPRSASPLLRGPARRRRRRDERGAVLVETAFAIPILLAILLGTIEFGLVYSTGSVTTGSSRAGARLAATSYAPAGTAATAQATAADSIAAAVSVDLASLQNAVPIGMAIYEVNPAAPDGAPVGGFPGNLLSGGCTASCIRYTWNGTAMVRSSGSWSDPDGCGTVVDSIGVFVQVRHRYVTGVIGTDRLVNGHTTMRIEPLPSEQC